MTNRDKKPGGFGNPPLRTLSRHKIARRLFMILTFTAIFLAHLTPVYPQTPTPTAYPPDPPGCLRPPEDYTRAQVNGSTLNARTIAMLEHAQTLYGGRIDLTGAAVTQGSYNAGEVALSFGTHDGGGAVDISVRNLPVDYSILWDDIPVLIQALRAAGFAAFYRDEDDDMTPHIHAIAIGDAELSRAAALQLTGRYGYFRGFDALPQPDGVPQPDTSGEIILCNWMRELGYEDLRDETVVQLPPYVFNIGDTLYTNTVWGQELNLRAEPTIRADILLKMPNETPVTVMDGPRPADGYRWWLLRTEDGVLGWAVEAADGGYTLVP